MVDQLAIWIQGAYQTTILFRVGWFKQMYGWEMGMVRPFHVERESDPTIYTSALLDSINSNMSEMSRLPKNCMVELYYFFIKCCLKSIAKFDVISLL